MEKYLALGFILVCAWHFKSQIKALLVKMGIMKDTTPSAAPAANASAAPAANNKNNKS